MLLYAIIQALCCNTPSRQLIHEKGLGRDELILGRGAFGTVVLGQWRGMKVGGKENVLQFTLQPELGIWGLRF